MFYPLPCGIFPFVSIMETGGSVKLFCFRRLVGDFNQRLFCVGAANLLPPPLLDHKAACR